VRRLACALALALAATAAVGQTRPSSRSMTCQAARQLVASRGAVVLSTYAFDRYVSSSLFCVLGETTEPAWIPTADTSQCFAGHRCRETGLDLYGR
jgi:hypothetical protein